MIASMSGKGNCYDNAVAESLFATLEFELLMQNDWHRREDARHAIFRYIEIWYNRSDVTRPSAMSARRRTKSGCRRQRSSYHSRVHRIG
jgi:transposase InsO family protein